jgi:hypothetical protein
MLLSFYATWLFPPRGCVKQYFVLFSSHVLYFVVSMARRRTRSSRFLSPCLKATLRTVRVYGGAWRCSCITGLERYLTLGRHRPAQLHYCQLSKLFNILDRHFMRFSLFSFLKEKCRLMRSPSCLCVCPPPPSTSEPNCRFL